MEPERFSTFGMYGNKEVFNKRAKEGYTEVAFGIGEWISRPIGEERIVGLYAFYHPNGKVSTYEHPKANHGFGNVHGQPFEAEYNAKRTLLQKLLGKSSTFEQHLKEFKITLDQRNNLAKIVKLLNENGGEQ